MAPPGLEVAHPRIQDAFRRFGSRPCGRVRQRAFPFTFLPIASHPLSPAEPTRPSSKGIGLPRRAIAHRLGSPRGSPRRCENGCSNPTSANRQSGTTTRDRSTSGTRAHAANDAGCFPYRRRGPQSGPRSDRVLPHAAEPSCDDSTPAGTRLTARLQLRPFVHCLRARFSRAPARVGETPSRRGVVDHDPTAERPLTPLSRPASPPVSRLHRKEPEPPSLRVRQNVELVRFGCLPSTRSPAKPLFTVFT